MRLLFLLILCVSILFSSEVTAGEKEEIPKILGFTVNESLGNAENHCASFKDSTWEILPPEKEFPGQFFSCKTKVKDYTFWLMFYTLDTKVVYIRAMIDTDSLCIAMRHRIKSLPCVNNGEQWEFCGDNWQLNCYIVEENISVVDLTYDKTPKINL